MGRDPVPQALKLQSRLDFATLEQESHHLTEYGYFLVGTLAFASPATRGDSANVADHLFKAFGVRSAVNHELVDSLRRLQSEVAAFFDGTGEIESFFPETLRA